MYARVFEVCLASTALLIRLEYDYKRQLCSRDPNPLQFLILKVSSKGKRNFRIKKCYGKTVLFG